MEYWEKKIHWLLLFWEFQRNEQFKELGRMVMVVALDRE
jgi:hypothetical protein